MLTEKYNLLHAVQKHCELHKENPWDYLPVTFYVEITDLQNPLLYNQALNPFIQCYQSLEQTRAQLGELKEKLIAQLARGLRSDKRDDACGGSAAGGSSENEESQRLSMSKKLDHISVAVTAQPKSGEHTKFKAFTFDRRHGQRYTMPLCHFDAHNLWMLKPTDMNCGRGIHVFRDLDSLHRLIKQYCLGKQSPKKPAREQAKSPADPA